MRSIRRVASLASRIDWQFVRRIRAVGRPLGSLSPARENRVRLALFLAAIAMVVAAFLLRDQLTLTQVGYGGIALASLIASAGLIIPVPALAAVCIGGAFSLNPLVVGLVAGSAETVGNLRGTFSGTAGRGWCGAAGCTSGWNRGCARGNGSLWRCCSCYPWSQTLYSTLLAWPQGRCGSLYGSSCPQYGSARS